MEDIVPELYKQIKDEFDGLVSSDEEIQTILSGKNDKATFSDVSLLARRLGEYAADSLSDNFTEASLPDGVLYWNIMERTIIPIMKEVHNLSIQMADIVQIASDKKQNIGIKPQHPEFQLERVTAVMNMLANIMEEENNGEVESGTDIEDLT